MIGGLSRRLGARPVAALRRGVSGAWGRDDGVIAIEFALLAPVFLLLIFAVMVLTLYFGTIIAVGHAASEGARASVGGIASTERQTLASTRVKQIFEAYEPFLEADNVIVTTPSSTVPGAFQVKVAYPADTIGVGPFFSLMSAVTGVSMTQPQTINRTVTVATGGY